MRLPRFLWVPFELGRPFGAPNEPEFQRRVLLDALALFERCDGPTVLADFPDDAPAVDYDIPWACPVSYAPAAADEDDLLANVRAEIATLAPWAELAVAPSANTGLDLGGMVDRLGLIAAIRGGEDAAEEDEAEGDDLGSVDIEEVRLVADDLHTWYLHAAAQQPGRATSHERNAWFWRETAVAHLLGQVAAVMVHHPDWRVRAFAKRGIVPRRHRHLLVPDRT